MGTILGVIVGALAIIAAWNGELRFWGIPIFLLAVIAGILLFPKTIGTFMSVVVSASVIAFIAALINGHDESAIAAVFIGVGALLTQFAIGKLR